MTTDSRKPIPAARYQRGAVDGFSMRQLLDVFRRRRRWVVIPLVLCAVAAAAVAFTLPATYTSEVVIAAESLDVDPAGGSVVDVRNHLATISSLLRRRSVLEQIVKEFGLQQGDAEQIPREMLVEIQNNLDISVESEESIKIAYTSTEPVKARDIAARLTDLFIAEMSSARRNQQDAVGGVLDSEIVRLEKQLADQEGSIEAYKEQSLGALPGDEGAHVSELRRLRDELQRKQDEITDAESERVSVVAEMGKLEELGAIDPDTQIMTMRAELASLLRRYTDRHPAVIRLQREIDAMEVDTASNSNGDDRASGTDYVGGNGSGSVGEPGTPPTENQLRYIRLGARLESLDRALDNFERDRRDTDAQIAATEDRLSAMPANERALTQLERDYRVTRAQYESLVTRQQDSRVSRQLAQTSRGLSFRVVEPARMPVEPSGPPRLRLMLLGLGIGVAVAGALTFTVEQTDASFVGIDEFHAFTDMPVLAYVPRIAGRGRGGSKSKLVTLHEPLNVATEQYRLLAMKVREHLDRDKEKVLMVTSSAGGEGKTTTSINLAVALARLVDGRVLLIDGDLRWPRIHEYLNEALKNRFAGPATGLADLLKGAGDDAFRTPMRIGSLHVVADDEGTEESFETLASSSAPALFAELRERFDYIVVDAPPILPMADSHMLATFADQILFVVRAQYTRREHLERALESLDFDKVPGVALNDVDYSRTRYGSVYRYYNQHYARAK